MLQHSLCFLDAKVSSRELRGSPPTSTLKRGARLNQPSTFRGTVKWVPAKGRWCSAAGSKGRHGV